MAKNKQTLFPLSGTLAGLTFVHSATYGAHVRRARGTVNPAPVNKSLQQNASRAPRITALGAPLLQCFKEMGGSFVQRGLWQVMMKRMFSATGVTVDGLLRSLEGLELNKDYPLDKLVGVLPALKLSAKAATIAIELKGTGKVKFARGLKMDSYRYELFVTWVNSKGDRLEGDVQQTEWLPVAGDAMRFNFKFRKEGWAKYMLVVVKLQGGNKAEPDARLGAVAMRVMKVFEV
jgi:hypothetical protein